MQPWPASQSDSASSTRVVVFSVRTLVPVLVALGLRPDGKKEVLDVRLATVESAAEWEAFPTDLYRAASPAKVCKMISVDAGGGLLAALPTVYSGLPVQRCWVHEIRNILGGVGRGGHDAVKADLSTVLLSGRVSSGMVSAAADSDKGIAAAGSIITGGLMTGVASFVGFFLGTVLLIAGRLVLSLGGRREVIIRDR